MVEAEAEFELVLKLLYYGIHLPRNLPMVGENQWTHFFPKWIIIAKFTRKTCELSLN